MAFKFSMTSAAAAVVLLGLTSGAQAATVTDLVTFSDTGSYGTDGGAPWNGSATASGSFTITFDPTQLYLGSNTAGLSNVSVSINDNRFSSASYASNFSFSYAYGTLDIYTGSSASKTLDGTNNIVIGINGWTNSSAENSVWYSQPGSDTLTTNGSASVSAVPLPTALPLFGSALIGLGALARRRRKSA